MWHLVADSACDLYELEGTEGKMDFATIPFTIRIGGKEYVDDENMPVSEMLEANETHDEMAQTACPSPEAWREKFSAPGPVIAFTISGALSGCYNSACLGRDMLLEDEPDKQIIIIDTRNHDSSGNVNGNMYQRFQPTSTSMGDTGWGYPAQTHGDACNCLHLDGHVQPYRVPDQKLPYASFPFNPNQTDSKPYMLPAY